MACFDDHLRWSVWPVILIVMSLTSVESELGVTISTLYQRLLQEIGPGTLRSGSEIYYPLAVRELYQPFFDNVVMLFQPCFPLCCDNQWQEIWVIDADQKIAVPIGHETVPDEWPEDE